MMKKILVSFTYPGDKKGLNLGNFKDFDKVYVIADAVKTEEQLFNCRKGSKRNQFTEGEIVEQYPQTEFVYNKAKGPNPSGEMKNFGETYVMDRVTDNEAIVYFMDGNKTCATSSSLDLVLKSCEKNDIDIVPSQFNWSADLRAGKCNERYFIDCGWLYVITPKNYELFKKYRPMVFNEIAPEAFPSYHDLEHFKFRACHCSLINDNNGRIDQNVNSSAPHERHVYLWNLAAEQNPAHKEIQEKYLYEKPNYIAFQLKRKYYGEKMRELVLEVNEKIFNKKPGEYIER